MKIRKIGLIIVIVFSLSILTVFIYTRFYLDKYEINGDKLTFKNNIYVGKSSLSAFDEENIGKVIGIGIDGERTITDYIWPFWVMEFKDDKEHNHIFVRGLMDLGRVYEKDFK